jgi:hypothetical protein
MVHRAIRRKKRGSRRLIKKRRRMTRKQGGGSPSKTIDLVISRYKEPVSWLGLYKNKGFHRIIVYNKSDSPFECPAIENKHTKCEVIGIPNVGVCDHTYLYHIVENYDNLADVTVFAPGSAEMDHKAQLLEMTMKKVFETKDTVFNVYDFKMSVGEAMYNFTMPTYPTGHLDNRDNLGGESPQALANIRPFGAWYAANFPGGQATKATFFGIMAISREHIHKKPVSFYKGLIEQVNKEKFHEASHFMERAWNASMHPIPDSCYYESEIMNFKIGHDQGGYKVMRR